MKHSLKEEAQKVAEKGVVGSTYPASCAVEVEYSVRRHGNDVYLGMSLVQNGGSNLMYWHTSVKLAQQSRTGASNGHG